MTHDVRKLATLAGVCLGAFAAAAAGCRTAPALTQLLEARRLVADLRLQFDTAAGASTQAVGAATVEAAAAETRRADVAAQTVQGQARALRPILDAPSYITELRLLNEFDERFAAFRTLDRAIVERSIPDATLAESLARRRLLAAACDESLRALQAALQRHDAVATR